MHTKMGSRKRSRMKSVCNLEKWNDSCDNHDDLNLDKRLIIDSNKKMRVEINSNKKDYLKSGAGDEIKDFSIENEILELSEDNKILLGDVNKNIVDKNIVNKNDLNNKVVNINSVNENSQTKNDANKNVVDINDDKKYIVTENVVKNCKDEKICSDIIESSEYKNDVLDNIPKDLICKNLDNEKDFNSFTVNKNNHKYHSLENKTNICDYKLNLNNKNNSMYHSLSNKNDYGNSDSKKFLNGKFLFENTIVDSVVKSRTENDILFDSNLGKANFCKKDDNFKNFEYSDFQINKVDEDSFTEDSLMSENYLTPIKTRLIETQTIYNSYKSHAYLDPSFFIIKPETKPSIFYDPRVFYTDDPDLEAKYQINSLQPKTKPPFSYAQLIAQAIKTCDSGKMQLKQIYDWISNNYDFYKRNDPTWHNSIRHNLSMNKMFKKVEKDKDAPGKGGYWMLNKEHCDKENNRQDNEKPLILQNNQINKGDTNFDSPIYGYENDFVSSKYDNPYRYFYNPSEDNEIGKVYSPHSLKNFMRVNEKFQYSQNETEKNFSLNYFGNINGCNEKLKYLQNEKDEIYHNNFYNVDNILNEKLEELENESNKKVLSNSQNFIHVSNLDQKNKQNENNRKDLYDFQSNVHGSYFDKKNMDRSIFNKTNIQNDRNFKFNVINRSTSMTQNQQNEIKKLTQHDLYGHNMIFYNPEESVTHKNYSNLTNESEIFSDKNIKERKPYVKNSNIMFKEQIFSEKKMEEEELYMKNFNITYKNEISSNMNKEEKLYTDNSYIKNNNMKIENVKIPEKNNLDHYEKNLKQTQDTLKNDYSKDHKKIMNQNTNGTCEVHSFAKYKHAQDTINQSDKKNDVFYNNNSFYDKINTENDLYESFFSQKGFSNKILTTQEDNYKEIPNNFIKNNIKKVNELEESCEENIERKNRLNE